MKHFCAWIPTWCLLHFIDIFTAQRSLLQDTHSIILQQSHIIMELPEHVNRQWPNFYLGTASGLLVPITLQKKNKNKKNSAEVGEQFRWLKIDCCVLNFNWQLLWLILFGLRVSLYNNFSSNWWVTERLTSPINCCCISHVNFGTNSPLCTVWISRISSKVGIN